MEKERLENSNAQTGNIWAGNFTSEMDAIELLADLGFTALIESFGADGYTKDSPELVAFF